MHQIMLDATMRSRHAEERGGSPHVVKRLDPARTAHLIIDMQNGFLEIGAPVEVPLARGVVPAINRVSRALRRAGGHNVFVQFTTPPDPASWSAFYERFTPQAAAQHQAAFQRDAHLWQLWPELDVDDARDARIEKQRLGAFIPGTCDLDAWLRARGIDTLIVSGTLTNCCCESTARDAMQLNYRVIFPSDTNAALSDAEHNATLHSMAFIFGDVMTVAEIESLLAPVSVAAS